uniref:Uncharacterized protein n=1 Tax=Trichuris muris TaxID=70415 RepID=A0A5S6Q1V4_TRIMR
MNHDTHWTHHRPSSSSSSSNHSLYERRRHSSVGFDLREFAIRPERTRSDRCQSCPKGGSRSQTHISLR